MAQAEVCPATPERLPEPPVEQVSRRELPPDLDTVAGRESIEIIGQAQGHFPTDDPTALLLINQSRSLPVIRPILDIRPGPPAAQRFASKAKYILNAGGDWVRSYIKPRYRPGATWRISSR